MSSHPLESAHGAVFRALGDPTRRALLDLLSGGARTTGDLCGQFEMSRFGVMKHLGVLQDAGLLTVERRGRERFNHLNAVPLREVYGRWVSRYADRDATRLLALKNIVEDHEKGEDMGDSDSGRALSFVIQQEVALAATPARVWQALTTDLGRWWGFHTEEFETEITLDPRIGGHFMETWGDESEGFIWGTVTYLRKGEKLRLRGCLGSKSGAQSQYTYELHGRDGGTLLTLHHSCVGHEDVEDEQRYAEGWKALFGTFLKGYLEDGKTWDQLKS
jgi:DNA-binding transcriptional ArsR family regulator/uncharacterized protein YndB with AHSA1/START domain